MTRPDVLSSVRSTCEDILSRRSIELVTLDLKAGPGRQILEILVDRVDPAVPLDELTEISEEISRALDIEDPIPGRYHLEVATAGLERPLVRPSDYVRFEGRQIRLKLSEPIEGRSSFKGLITSSNDETFVLQVEGGGVVEIDYGSVFRANLVVDWEKELKGGLS